MSDTNDLARATAIVTSVLRQLRKSVRQERRRQRFRRFFGRTYFELTQFCKKPTEVNMARTGITALWQHDSESPIDLDVPYPSTVHRRSTVGQMWEIRHEDYALAIVLVVDSAGVPWLIPYGQRRFAGTPDGWRKLMAAVGPRIAQHRGGRWQGAG